MTDKEAPPQRPLTRAEQFRSWVERTSYAVTDKTSAAIPPDEGTHLERLPKRKGKRKNSDQ